MRTDSYNRKAPFLKTRNSKFQIYRLQRFSSLFQETLNRSWSGFKLVFSMKYKISLGTWDEATSKLFVIEGDLSLKLTLTAVGPVW